MVKWEKSVILTFAELGTWFLFHSICKCGDKGQVVDNVCYSPVFYLLVVLCRPNSFSFRVKAGVTWIFEIVFVKLQRNSAELGHKPPSVLVRNAFWLEIYGFHQANFPLLGLDGCTFQLPEIYIYQSNFHHQNFFKTRTKYISNNLKLLIHTYVLDSLKYIFREVPWSANMRGKEVGKEATLKY